MTHLLSLKQRLQLFKLLRLLDHWVGVFLDQYSQHITSKLNQEDSLCLETCLCKETMQASNTTIIRHAMHQIL